MRFSEKVSKAERKWVEGGIYICPNCDGDNPLCDDDYQSQECEIHQAERLADEENMVKESFRMKKDGKQNKHTLIFNEGV